MKTREELNQMTMKAIAEYAESVGISVNRKGSKAKAIDKIVSIEDIFEESAEQMDKLVLTGDEEMVDCTQQETEQVVESEEPEAEEQVVESEETEKPKKEKKEKAPKVDIKAIADRVAQQVGGVAFDVKPGGYGVKVGKFRAFALYNNRAGKVRLKSARIDRVAELLNEYDTTISMQYTADGRDVLLDFNYSEEDTVEAFCEELAGTSFTRKKAARKPEEQVVEGEAVEA